MTAGPVSRGTPNPPPRHAHTARSNEVSRTYSKHSTAKRVNTDVVVVEAIRAEYPQLHLSVIAQYNCNIVAWAASGKAGLAPIDNEKDRFRERFYAPPATRLGGGRGLVGDEVHFGKFLLDWDGKEYIIYIVNGRDGSEAYPEIVNQYVLSPSIESTNQLLIEAGLWGNELHEQIWVYDGGYWQQSSELYESIRNASWDDVILPQTMKDTIINDVNTFFDSRDTYEKLQVPWKRGVIYYGPPGNGKTISIKATMSMLYKRKEPIPTLYVKTLTSFFGPEYSINEIFSLARRTAPCYLVFEDLDSIVSDDVRSFFLNAVDGIAKNDGILMVGSTNHLDRLDPGIVKRPSRFDRKCFYDNPTAHEREMYMHYWQGKLASNADVDFPDKLCPAVAKITKGFSFAYLQEAMVASLLVLARKEKEEEADASVSVVCLNCMQTHGNVGKFCEREAQRGFKGLYEFCSKVRGLEDEDSELEKNVLWREIRRQVRILREELESEGKK